MTRSSPARRSQLLSSPERPERPYLSSFLSDDRNNEGSHLDALAAAQQQHDRVREAAIRVYELHELKEQHQRILEEERIEKERLKREEEIAKEQRRLNELRARSIPRPEPTPEPKQEPEQKPEPKAEPTPEPVKTQEVKSEEAPKPAPAVQTNGLFGQKKPEMQPPAQPTQAAQPPPKPAAPQQQAPPQVAPQTNGVAPAATAAPAAPKTEVTQSPRRALADRYTQIHQELKKLRKFLTDEAKRPESPLKGKLGQARREIRMAIGQLTGVKGANAQPINKIMATLRATLDGTMPSPPVQVSTYMTDTRQPLEGAQHNEDTLPALFIYLINIFSKGIISQFINEGGANPKAADPVGVSTAHVFSAPEFLWRGQSLIDILMAKFRVVCPVLFGFRANDRTERGRTALGWRRDDGGSWITEQAHNDRMTGLGAGFASIALRDFSKSKKENPYPPTNYWTALASILNTPKGEVSNTQYVVLRSMIEGHEQRFLTFYGNAALAALKIALVDFPTKAPDNASAAGSLRALAEVLKTEGLNLG